MMAAGQEQYGSDEQYAMAPTNAAGAALLEQINAASTASASFPSQPPHSMQPSSDEVVQHEELVVGRREDKVQARVHTFAQESRQLGPHYTCSLCQSLYTDPRFLDCLHTFCLGCLEKQGLKPHQIIECPKCRQPTPLREKGVNGLMQNSAMLTQVQEIQDGWRNCDNCDDTPTVGSLYCSQCDAHLCKPCSDQLHTQKVNRNHHVVHTMHKGRFRKPPSCAQHGPHEFEPLSYYCMECAIAVCSHCLIKGKHIGHHSIELNQAAHAGKVKLDHMIGGIKEKASALQDSIANLDALVHTSDEQMTQQLQIVDEKFDEMHKALAKRKQEVMEQVKNGRDQRIDQLRQQQGNIMEMVYYLQDSYTTVEHQIGISNQWQFLESEKYIRNKLQNTETNINQFEQHSAQRTIDEVGSPVLDDSLLQHIAQYAEPNARRIAAHTDSATLSRTVHNATLTRSPVQGPASPHNSPAAANMATVPPVSIGQTLQPPPPQHSTFFSQGSLMQNVSQGSLMQNGFNPSAFNFGSVGTNWPAEQAKPQ